MKEKKFNYGWIIVIYGALVMSTLHYTCFNSFGLFVVPITESLGISRAALSLSMTIGSVAGIIISPIAGNILAKKSIKKYMFLGILVSGLCILGESFASSVYHLYILNLFLQFSSTFALALPFSALMLRWFSENRSLATSIIFVGVSLGGVLFASPLTSLITAYGWRTAYMVIGLVILCLDAPLCLLIVRDFPKAPADNSLSKATANAALRSASNSSQTTEQPSQIQGKNKGITGTSRFWFLTAGLFFNSFACVALYHIPAFIQSLGYTASLAAKMVSFYSLINIFSKIIMGFLFDRFGLKSGVLFGAIGTVGCYAFMIVASFSPSLAMLFVFSFLFGIGLATQSMFMPSLIGGIYGKQQYSIIYGKISVFTLLASAISNPSISLVFDITGSYQIAWMICVVISILCGLFLLAACRKSI